jgi:hypothetical protein
MDRLARNARTYFAFAEAEPFMVEHYQAGVCSPPTRQVGLALLTSKCPRLTGWRWRVDYVRATAIV